MRTTTRSIAIAAAIGTTAFALAGCVPDSEPSSSSSGATGTSFTVAFSDPIGANTYMQAMEAATKKTVEAAGGTYISRDENLDPNQQVSDLESFISQGVDVIIVPMPPVYDAIKPELAKARAAGIKVIGMNLVMNFDPAWTPDAPLDAQVIEDRPTAAQDEVDYLATQSAGGDVLIIGGPAPSPAIDELTNDVTTALGKLSQFKIYQTVNNPTDDIAGAKPLVAAALASDPNIVAVLAYNDASAVGAAQAAADAGRSLVIEGLQAMPEGIAALSAGQISATVDVDVVGTGKLLGDIAVKAATGGSGWQKNHVQPTKLLTKDNVADFKSWDDQLGAL